MMLSKQKQVSFMQLWSLAFFLVCIMANGLSYDCAKESVGRREKEQTGSSL